MIVTEWQGMEPDPSWDEDYTKLWRERERLQEKVRDHRKEIAELKATIALSDDDKLDEACAFEEERTARKAYQAENAKLKAQAEIDKDFIKQYQSEHGITVPWPSKERSQ